MNSMSYFFKLAISLFVSSASAFDIFISAVISADLNSEQFWLIKRNYFNWRGGGDGVRGLNS